MSQVKCPRCATVVESPAFGAPVCPACGFGGEGTQPAAPTTVVVQQQQATAATNGKAITALVLGIVGCCIGGLFLGIPAIVFGVLAHREIKASPGMRGSGLATAGVVLGILATVGSVAYLVFVLAVGGPDFWEEVLCEQRPSDPRCDDRAATAPAGLPNAHRPAPGHPALGAGGARPGWWAGPALQVPG